MGWNAKAAQLSGMNVERLQMVAFTLMGLLASLAGIIYAARVATASSTIGVGKELGAITAAILGGASLTGGRGTAWGALLGVFFMALIQNMLLIKQNSGPSGRASCSAWSWSLPWRWILSLTANTFADMKTSFTRRKWLQLGEARLAQWRSAH